MENKLLQSILQAGLLDIGDSDERLENIEKSIADLETKLKKEQTLLPAYTLVALDPNINTDEPVLADVEAIIATHWKALRAKFSETPVPIIRAVILHALYNVGTQDAKIARIIYLKSTNFYKYAKFGREKEVIEKIISDLGELAENNATDEWALNEDEPSIKLTALRISGFTFDAININRDELKADLRVAVSNDPTHNHGSNNGGNGHWGEHFANKSSDAITKVFNSAISEFSKSLSPSSLETPINKFFSEFKKSLDEVLKTSFNSIQSVERRSKLLWWKETLYSSSLKDSYRSTIDIIQPIVMANDLYQQLPAIVPVSVDYLLKDTLLLLNSKAGEKMKFSELLGELSKDANKALLKEYFDDKDAIVKRISFTDFIALIIYEKVEPSSLKQYTGIEGKEQVSLTDIAVMILHDLMAEYLITKSE